MHSDHGSFSTRRRQKQAPCRPGASLSNLPTPSSQPTHGRRKPNTPVQIPRRHKNGHCRGRSNITACPKKPSACLSVRWFSVSDNAKDWEGKETMELPQQHKVEREPHHSRKMIASIRLPKVIQKKWYTMTIPTCRSIDLPRAKITQPSFLKCNIGRRTMIAGAWSSGMIPHSG